MTTVFNFTRPSGDLPALLSVEEASTLYHEFGHALDAFLIKVPITRLILPGTLLNCLLSLWNIGQQNLKFLTCMQNTIKQMKQFLPELVQKIKNSGYFNQGFETVEYLAASLLDMKYHTLEAPVNIDIQTFEKEYFKEIGLIPEIISRYRSTYFLHIVGGYDAGYYSYIWAAVLDNDAFEAFKEKGIFDKVCCSVLPQKYP